MNSIVARFEALAIKFGTQMHTMIDAFELFLEKELAPAAPEPANDTVVAPTVVTIAPSTEAPKE